MAEATPRHTGGCQCGEIRYALAAEPFNPHICHCRMCQKAGGGLFMPFASVNLESFTWTRGSPGIFKSSAVVERGFCRGCGTPLSYRNIENAWISLTTGSFDAPERLPPAVQLGTESRMSWFARLKDLPGIATEDQFGPADHAKFASRQHPDFEG